MKKTIALLLAVLMLISMAACGADDGKYVIGWDYAHYGDYLPDASGAYGAHKKWNTTEIVNEVTEVCKQLRELNDKEG